MKRTLIIALVSALVPTLLLAEASVEDQLRSIQRGLNNKHQIQDLRVKDTAYIGGVLTVAGGYSTPSNLNVNAKLTVGGTSIFSNNVALANGADLSIAGSLLVTGRMTNNAAVIMQNTLQVNGATLSGDGATDMTLFNDATFSGNISGVSNMSAKTASLTGALTVGGGQTNTGPVVMNGTLSVNGATLAGDGATDITLFNDATLSGNVNITSNLTANSLSIAAGGAAIGGGAVITGDVSTTSGDLVVNGNTRVDSNLTVTGTTKLTGLTTALVDVVIGPETKAASCGPTADTFYWQYVTVALTNDTATVAWATPFVGSTAPLLMANFDKPVTNWYVVASATNRADIACQDGTANMTLWGFGQMRE